MYYPEPIGILMWLARGENPAPEYCKQEEVDAALQAAGLTMETVKDNVVEVENGAEDAAFQDNHEEALKQSLLDFRARVADLKEHGFSHFYSVNIDGYYPWIATKRQIEGQVESDPLAEKDGSGFEDFGEAQVEKLVSGMLEDE